MPPEYIFFAIFLGFICLVLALDLGIFSKADKQVTFKNAFAWTSVWITFSIIFFLFLKQSGNLVHGIESQEELLSVTKKYQPDMVFPSANFEENLSRYNSRISIDYLTGYFIEYSLSIDNLFVILLIFNSFAVPSIYHKKVLLWGVIGAIVLRMLFIFSGSALISSFHWILYIFGGFLIFSGLKILFSGNEEEKIDIEKHPVVRFTSKYFSVWPDYVNSKFVHIADGKKHLTPLFIVLLVVEFSDLVFAVDSVPAIFSVTKDPYIVFFSNIFAIMGLRSLFFLLSNVMHLFSYLKYGLGLLLAFIGVKMIFEHWFISIGFNNIISLIVILGILSTSILLSVLFPKKRVIDTE
jgi:tellurite resistance protein TerC